MAIPRKRFEVVKARDGGSCIVQGPHCVGAGQVPHHRANRGQGGAGRTLDGFSNLVLSCGPCNGWIEDCSGDARDDLVARGLRIFPGRTHAHTAKKALAVPVVYPDGVPYWLDDDGNKSGQPF